MNLPRYPVYVPSKGRFQNCKTAKFLSRDKVPFRLVVVESEVEEYGSRFGEERLIVLPPEVKGLRATRNWIKDHSVEEGAVRHWQLDDNITDIWRHYRGERLHCRAGVALRVAEDFVDRYENVAVAGLDYVMFGMYPKRPFSTNIRIYSCSLVLNSIPYRWRCEYNDDADLCLQVLSGGWCTVLFHAFMIQKIGTMKMGGGNTDALYRGDGRLRMARSLERLWPGVVKTSRRFGRPQHWINGAWSKFDTPLKRKPEAEVEKMEKVDEYGMRLVEVKEVQSEKLKRMVADQSGGATTT